ncbi:transcriptional regulator [Longibacter salinarum]|uniref:Transcriptional regulator n=1 Tax=Longibacter salinarum TaxID=1850348 RepID=A0A2A8D2C9_9BACT|nr:ATP-binding protein [Longibacter salinarum]PEN15044.1 transcriptional regulator [Longibacter salinarum]
MTLGELKQIVSLGEGISLEFKRRVPRDERIAKEVIALANTQGGRILVGVDDDGTITGLDDASEQEFVLRRAVRRRTFPEVDIRTERVVVAPRRDVILVTVPESDQKPHHLVDEGMGPGDGTAYVRVEDMSVEASGESVEMMESANSMTGVTFEFGEAESLLMRYLDDYGRITVGEFAKLADISAEEASATLVRLSKANLLRLHADRKEDYFTLAY